MRRGGACLGVDDRRARPPSGGYLAAADLERQLGNAFRKGLYRLAVMSQKTEDAMDLGQRLPTGLLRDVSCDVGAAAAERAGGPWSWTCKVSWRSVEGRAQRTTLRGAPAAR